jgi:hypothetical protein
MPLKEFDDGIGSGKANAAAFVPENEKLLIAETRSETSVPIIIPTVSVAAINPAATILRRRVQSTIPFRPSSIFLTPVSAVAQSTSGEYNTPAGLEFVPLCDASRGVTGHLAGLAWKSIYTIPLTQKSGNMLLARCRDNFRLDNQGEF